MRNQMTLINRYIEVIKMVQLRNTLISLTNEDNEHIFTDNRIYYLKLYSRI